MKEFKRTASAVSAGAVPRVWHLFCNFFQLDYLLFFSYLFNLIHLLVLSCWGPLCKSNSAGIAQTLVHLLEVFAVFYWPSLPGPGSVLYRIFPFLFLFSWEGFGWKAVSELCISFLKERSISEENFLQGHLHPFLSSHLFDSDVFWWEWPIPRFACSRVTWYSAALEILIKPWGCLKGYIVLA